MYKRHPILLSITLILAILISFSLAKAQSEVRLSALEVDLWPEYDNPNMLVIYRVTLAPNVSLPVDLTFRIPAAAGDPSAVAVKQVITSGEAGLFTIPFERQVSGEWGLVTLTATMPEVQLEYYDPSLQKQGSMRQFEYRWPGDYAVDVFTIEVQQPLGATEMRISPSTDPGETRQDGMVYFSKQVGSLPVGQTFRLSVEYQKENDDLSAASLPVQPSAPTDEGALGQGSLREVLPWLLAFLGLVLIVGGVVWYWTSGRGDGSAKPRRRRRSAVQAESTQVSDSTIYCHQCGKRAAPGDRFCRTCGTRLRVG